jgi:leucyl/phenylalanyl-tRNA--protein transferase
MTIFLLSDEYLVFPDPRYAEADGLLAVGGDLSTPRLLAAYTRGIFPWYGPGSPILWWSPDPRMTLFPSELYLSRRLRRTVDSDRFEITLDRAFDEVIVGCAKARRPEGEGTWLVPEMIEAYKRLHREGVAHSCEAWDGDELAGGVYGVSLGRAFFAESMFYDVPNASKVALVWLVEYLGCQGFELIDCQQSTPHSARFGAVELSRIEFLRRLARAVDHLDSPGPWRLPKEFRPAGRRRAGA